MVVVISDVDGLDMYIRVIQLNGRVVIFMSYRSSKHVGYHISLFSGDCVAST